MGNSPLTREFSARRLVPDEREAMKKFCEDEMHVLRETFKGLASARNGSSVDKETFLKCFPLPGLLGERLFEVVDKDGSGSIGYSEFVYGLAILLRGTRKEKLKLIFDLYDLSEAGSISRHELLTMLHQFPPSALELIRPLPLSKDSSSTSTSAQDDIDAVVNLAFPPARGENSRLTFDQFCDWCDSTPGIANFLMSVLPSEDPTQAAVAPLDASAHSSSGGQDHLDTRKKRNSFTNLHVGRSHSRERAMSLSTVDNAHRKELEKTQRLLLEAKAACPAEIVSSKIQAALEEVERVLALPPPPPQVSTAIPPAPSSASSSPTKQLSCGLISRNSITSAAGLTNACHKQRGRESSANEDQFRIAGDLWKRGSRLRQMIKRYYVLHGNFLYYYANKEDTAPRGVTFMCGCYIEAEPQEALVEKNVKFYAIEIVPEPGSSRVKRTIYTKSLEMQQAWTQALRQATDKVSIDAFYAVGRQLGRGRFSKVCEATHKLTGATHAVKIIDKSKLQGPERELLRTEIAILNLVTHPNIIRLHDVYEDKQHIFIVMELVLGGELFNRIVGRARYTEAEARLVMQPLLEAVAYLHRLGIVHRDIKPENILCGDQLNDLKIADFGLSKLVHPEEIMKMPCGTLNYVAPEVLSLVGYGREADIWSVGVIMYLLLRGELPFYGKTKNEIIQKTLHADVSLDGDAAWTTVSPAGKSLLKGLLTKEPSKRLTAQDALAHEWFASRPLQPRRSITSSH